VTRCPRRRWWFLVGFASVSGEHHDHRDGLVSRRRQTTFPLLVLGFPAGSGFGCGGLRRWWFLQRCAIRDDFVKGFRLHRHSGADLLRIGVLSQRRSGSGFSCRFWFWLRWPALMVVPPAVHDSRWLRQRFSSPSSQRRRSVTRRVFESATIWFCDLGLAFWVLRLNQVRWWCVVTVAGLVFLAVGSYSLGSLLPFLVSGCVGNGNGKNDFEMATALLWVRGCFNFFFIFNAYIRPRLF